MTSLDHTALTHALDTLPERYPGPGGVAGIVSDGRIIATRVWGYADLDRAQPMTAATRLPICSITKQFTCGVMLAEAGTPEAWDHLVAGVLTDHTSPLPSVRQLAANQSGLRDYWAMTVLQGARAEQQFTAADAAAMLARTQSGHFAPGTAYSYCNVNFRILAALIERQTGEPLELLYRRHLFDPAGMETAALTPDTRFPVDGVTGYEGDPRHGYLPADNGIWWSGDAGISASLDDMLAYEIWIDATRDDAGSLYQRLSAPPVFADGRPARYGFGLSHQRIGRFAATGHGGALRGFRLNRITVPAARLSAVVLFNHEGDAHGAAVGLLRAALAEPAPAAGVVDDGWAGAWFCPETGLSLRITPERQGATLHYATTPEALRDLGGGRIGNDGTVIARQGDGLTLTRPAEGMHTTLRRLSPGRPDAGAVTGRYHNPESGAAMEIIRRGDALSVVFEGHFGRGRPERLIGLSPHLWLMPTRRSMDAPAPGEWTVRLLRDEAGRPDGAVTSCWLARNVVWRRERD